MKIYWFYEEDCRICPRCGIEHTKRGGVCIMPMFVFWSIVTMLALLFGAGIAAMFCYGLVFKFVCVAVLGGAFLTWVLRP